MMLLLAGMLAMMMFASFAMITPVVRLRVSEGPGTISELGDTPLRTWYRRMAWSCWTF